jgi:pyrimidine deaminase RibD-like protein
MLFAKWRTPRDRRWMALALDEARKSVSAGAKADPFVGAVAVDAKGCLIASAHRGELKPGDHAEYTLLEKKLANRSLIGATLYSTLEPCTTRNHPKVPCARRVLDRGFGRVVIGTLDPNQDIRGRGEWLLLEHNVQVAKFDSDLARALLELNRDFIREQQGVGAAITSPARPHTANVAEFDIEGTYRNKPAANELWVFVRQGNVYWPQKRMTINNDNTWQCRVRTDPAGDYEILVAKVSEEMSLLIDFYFEVVQAHRDARGRTLPRLPKGLQVFDTIDVKRV